MCIGRDMPGTGKKHPHLPYNDTKSMGAADFYFAINSTFCFIARQLGYSALRHYWTQLGKEYFKPVSQQWQQGGLSAVADYWRDFFSAEPGSEVTIRQNSCSVVVDVHKCPAIAHLREHQREILPEFCQHCFFVSDAMCTPANLVVRVKGGNGSCQQVFAQAAEVAEGQDLAEIARVTQS